MIYLIVYTNPWTRNIALLRFQYEFAKFDTPQINAVTTSFLYVLSRPFGPEASGV